MTIQRKREGRGGGEREREREHSHPGPSPIDGSLLLKQAQRILVGLLDLPLVPALLLLNLLESLKQHQPRQVAQGTQEEEKNKLRRQG
jgi:hypothetical protein